MQCLIRADASITIGSGHIMRCLTVAYELQKKGFSIFFWMNELEGNLIEYVKSFGYNVADSPISVDLLIVDHYELDADWEKSMRLYCKKIIVIDDLANRHHDCDLLIDQNLIENYESRYDSLVPKSCIQLLGPKYLIMRQEFVEARKKSILRQGRVNRLLIFMGGTDPTFETIKILHAAKQGYYEFMHVDVVVGSGNPYKEEIKLLCNELNYDYHCQINYIAELMCQADFAIGAGGTTIWERCYVGLPSAVTVVADNQLESTKEAAATGAVIYLGEHKYVTIKTYIELFKSLEKIKDKIQGISVRCFNITENHGNANPWVNEMVGLIDD